MSDPDAPDIERLLARTAVRPARGPDPVGVDRRARRRTAVTRVAVASVAAVAAIGVGGWLAALNLDPGSEIALDDRVGAPGADGGEAGHPVDDDEAGGEADDDDAESQAGGDDGQQADDRDQDDEDVHQGQDSEPGDGAVPDEPPMRWVGARVAGDVVEVVVHDGPDEFVVAERPLTTSEQPDPMAVTDLAVDAVDAVGEALVGLCCEPASGAVWAATLEGDDLEFRRAELQGHRVGLSGDGSLLVTADTHGTFAIHPADPEGGETVIREAAGAIDVAAEPGTGDRVAALIDTSRTAAHTDEGDEQRGILLVEPDEAGDWQDRLLPLDEQACAVALLADDRVAVVRADEVGWQVDECGGRTVDVFDARDGQRVGAVSFPVAVGHLDVDGSGHHLIATSDDGAVRWATVDGDVGELAIPDHGEDSGGYAAADW